jgi:hypothetical protein
MQARITGCGKDLIDLSPSIRSPKRASVIERDALEFVAIIVD